MSKLHFEYLNVQNLSQAQYDAAYEGLSPSRKRHIDRLRRPEDRKRSLAADILVEKLLKEHWKLTGCVLHRRENGAPYLTGCDLCVSISHSGELVACAVSEQPVGIDIEQVKAIDLQITRHVCTPEEKTAIFGDAPVPEGICRDERMLRRFYEIWTAKEAWFKKQGTGITGLKSVNVLPLEKQTVHLEKHIIQIL